MDMSFDEEPPTNSLSSEAIDTNSPIELVRDRVDVGTNTSPKSQPDCNNDDSLDQDMTCSICFEEWDNSSTHRVVSLKCGHLFGRSCVERWLKGHQQCCPQCKAKSKRSDIRKVYAKSVKVKDTTERDRALKDLEGERAARLKLEIDLQKIKSQLNEANAQLQYEKDRQKRQVLAGHLIETSPVENLNSNVLSLQLTKSLEIRDGQCRVLATSPNVNFMAVSQYNPNKLFPGFGIRKINTHYLNLGDYIVLHKEAIRDMSFHPSRQNGLLLTASMDKSLKLTCIASNTIVHTFHTEKPVWSCTWNTEEDNHLFGGLNDGSVLLFDMRQTRSHLLKLPPTGSLGPVASLQYVPTLVSSENISNGGVIIGQLNRCSFTELVADGYKPHILPIRGPITSVSYEPEFRHMLVTCRPNIDHSTMTHTVYDLSMADDNCVCNVVHQFHGGNLEKMLGKNLLLKNPFNSQGLLACAGDETSLSTLLWNVQTGNALPKITSTRPVLAIGHLNIQESDRLATLTDSSVAIYSFALN